MSRKRYKSAQQITRDIDSQKVKFEKFLDMALIADNLGKDQEAKRYRIKARLIKDKHLDALKQKLADFQTELLPGVITDGDRSIPASTRASKRRTEP